MGVLDTIGYNGVLFFMFILTISRVTIFFSEKIDRIVFSPPGIYVVIVFVWVLTLTFTVILNMFACVKEFTTEALRNQLVDNTIRKHHNIYTRYSDSEWYNMFNLCDRKLAIFSSYWSRTTVYDDRSNMGRYHTAYNTCYRHFLIQ
uniref:Uncharacterized protein n=1 Tax=Acrobeloides nanus TaxID=290746 RepID=A0A914C5K0_9BILA